MFDILFQTVIKTNDGKNIQREGNGCIAQIGTKWRKGEQVIPVLSCH